MILSILMALVDKYSIIIKNREEKLGLYAKIFKNFNSYVKLGKKTCLGSFDLRDFSQAMLMITEHI